MRNAKKIVFVVFFMIVMFAIFTVTSNAATEYKAVKGEATENIGEQNYRVWSAPVYSYLYANTDGTLTRVEYLSSSKQLLIENYDSSFNLKSTKKVTNSLSMFGGFYSGNTYNFVVTGQRNPNEDNNLAVYRIEKYSKTWQKLGTADLKNCNTTIPFDAGSCRMVEKDGTLYIETCHEMYKSSDGYNHQANLGIEIDINTMNITYSRSNVMNQSTGYISHSFNQFIQAENGYSYTVNHGDGLLRGVGLIKREKGKTNATSWISTYASKGDINLNSTGMTVGGFELSNNNCIVAGSSIDQDATNWNLKEAYNIFVTVTNKNDFSQNKKVWLTKYAKDSKVEVTTPHLVKINGNKFVVMWEETNEDNGGLVKAALIDETGKQIGNTISIGGKLSDCKPILYKNNIIWYVTSAKKTMTMFSIDVSSDAAFANSNGKNVVSLKNILSHFTYKVNEYARGGITIKSFDNKIKTVDFTKINLPNWLVLYNIDANAFENATNLESLVLPETLNDIRYGAFSGCENLKGTIKIPKSVDIIYEYAFYGCDNVEKFVFESKDTALHDFAISINKTVEIGKTIRPIVGLNYTKIEPYDKEVATVSSDGTIKVAGLGATNIYYYSASGHKMASVVVEAGYKLGDANGDGYVDAQDAREVLKYCVGKSYLYYREKKAADVNKDGYVDAIDAREILKYCVGKITKF